MLLDVLEPLFYALAETPSGWSHNEDVALSRDVRLFFDVANANEMSTLHTHVLNHVFQRRASDSPHQLLRRFTHHPVHSRLGLDALPGTTCFRDLQLGLDIDGTYGHAAQRSFLDGFRGTFRDSAAMARRYGAFRRFILAPQNLLPPGVRRCGRLHDATCRATVTFVARRETAGTLAMTSRFPRAVLNAAALVRVAESAELQREVGALRVVRAVLGEIPFTEQLRLFDRTDVLVGVHGTGMHNVLFMRPGSAVLVFEQPGWCRWRWRFTGQATLLGVHSFVFCDDTDATLSAPFRSRFRWSARSWADGPTTTKDANVLVDIPAFTALLRGALAAATPRSDASAVAVPPPREHCVLRRADAPQCTLRAGDGEREAAAPPPARATTMRAVLLLDDVIASASSNGSSWTVRLVPQVIVDACKGSDDAACAGAAAPLFLCIAMVRSTDASALRSARNGKLCLAMDQLNAYHTIDVTLARGSESSSDATLGPGSAVASAWLEQLGAAGHGLREAVPNSHTLIGVDALAKSGEVTLSARLKLFDTARVRARVRVWPPVAALAVVIGDEVHLLRARLDIASELQHAAVDFCAQHVLDDGACVTLADRMHARARQEMHALAMMLPPTQPMPSPALPFVFLHHEKCAGSTLRR